VGEAATGATFIFVTDGVGATAGGIILVAHGFDETYAGYNQLISGEFTPNLTTTIISDAGYPNAAIAVDTSVSLFGAVSAPLAAEEVLDLYRFGNPTTLNSLANALQGTKNRVIVFFLDAQPGDAVLGSGLSPGVIRGPRTGGLIDEFASGGATLRRSVRQSEFDRIQLAIGSGGEVRLGRFFTPDDIVNPRIAGSQLALPGVGTNPVVGFVDVPRGVLPSEPLSVFGPRLAQPFLGDDLVRVPGGGLEVEFVLEPVVPGNRLRLVPTP
jgi:hypothetical protein